MNRKYNLIRTSRRSLALEVTREGKLIVRAPMRISQGKIDEFLEQKGEWIDKHIAAAKELPQRREPDEAELAELRRRAEKIIPKKVEYWSAVVGETPEKVAFSNAKSRFGSCSAKRVLRFSCRLMDYPNRAVDYIVLHEVAHLREMNHSARFYDIIESAMPDYKERIKLLR